VPVCVLGDYDAGREGQQMSIVKSITHKCMTNSPDLYSRDAQLS
jgi:hypothetical protein